MRITGVFLRRKGVNGRVFGYLELKTILKFERPHDSLCLYQHLETGQRLRPPPAVRVEASLHLAVFSTSRGADGCYRQPPRTATFPRGAKVWRLAGLPAQLLLHASPRVKLQDQFVEATCHHAKYRPAARLNQPSKFPIPFEKQTQIRPRAKFAVVGLWRTLASKSLFF